MENHVAEKMVYDEKGNEVFANNELPNRIRLALELSDFIEQRTKGKYKLDTSYFIAGKEALFLTQVR